MADQHIIRRLKWRKVITLNHLKLLDFYLEDLKGKISSANVNFKIQLKPSNKSLAE